MQNTIKLKENLFWVGANDRRISVFENAFPIQNGMAYNSYLLLDDKITLFDTVDNAVSEQFFDNLEHLLQGKQIDYLVVSHMEPDHSATISELILRYPAITLVVNSKQVPMLNNFLKKDISDKLFLVKEGDILDTGAHKLTFVMAPMVHWPEVMVTYDTVSKTLFSADAFGSFGAVNGSIVADPADFEHNWLPEARRYYANIVGKFGVQVNALLTKVSALDIDMICPLHGNVLAEDLDLYIDKYSKWATYQPEENKVVIVYASIYGHTQNAAEILATSLSMRGFKDIKIYDVSSTDSSVIVAEIFRCSHIVFASVTYNGRIFSKMENLLNDISTHGVRSRTVALMENGSWGATTVRQMTEIFSNMKDITILENKVKIKSSIKEAQSVELENMVDEIVASVQNTIV